MKYFGIVIAYLFMISQAVVWAEPIAIIVNRDNPLEALSHTQLARIYSGKMRKWPNGRPIAPINRPVSSSVRKRFYDVILDAQPAQQFRRVNSPLPFKTRRTQSDKATRLLVSKRPNSIGYLKLSEVDKKVKVLKIDGKSPTDHKYLLH